jgi:hypothetical protein
VDLLNQVELAGWHDAWRHEERGRGGRWVRGEGGGLTEQLAGKPDYQPLIDRIGEVRHKIDTEGGQDAISITLDRAITALGNGDHVEARKQLRLAAKVARYRSRDDDVATFNQLAKGVLDASHGKPLGDSAQHVDIDHVWQELGNLASDAQMFGDDDELADQITQAQDALHDGTPEAFASAASLLDNAVSMALAGGNRGLAKGIATQARLIRTARPQQVSESPRNVVQKFLAAKAAPALQQILGGKQQWNGRVQMVSRRDWPYTFGELTWQRGMRLREDIAGQIADDQAHPDKPVHDPHSYEVMLHELIHGVGTDPPDKDMDAYQDERYGAIEEGFTELGATQHMAEFADAVGIGDRQAPSTGTMKIRYPVPRAETRPVLAKIAAAHSLQTASPAELNALDHASSAVEDGDLDGAFDYITSAVDDYATKPEVKAQLAAIQDELNDLADKYAKASRPTVRQVAQVRAMPRAYDADTGPWGHYPWQTKAAWSWVAQVAHDEGLQGDAARLPRMTELADEINREGTARKPRVMAEQIARTIDHLDPSKMTGDDWETIISNIIEGFSPSISLAPRPDLNPVENAKFRAKIIAQRQMERERLTAA